MSLFQDEETWPRSCWHVVSQCSYSEKDNSSFKGSRFLILLNQMSRLLPDRMRTWDLHLLTQRLGQQSAEVTVALLFEIKAVEYTELQFGCRDQNHQQIHKKTRIHIKSRDCQKNTARLWICIMIQVVGGMMAQSFHLKVRWPWFKMAALFAFSIMCLW